MFQYAGWLEARCSSLPGWGRECRRCSCSLLNTSQSTRPHTSGSRCHSSGQSNISSRCAHTSSNQQVCIPLCSAGRSCKACKTVTPWACLLKKNTQTPGDEILEEITVWKNGLLFKSRIGIEDVLYIQKEFWEGEDADNCLSACPEHWASALLSEAQSKLSSCRMQYLLMLSANSLTNFHIYNAWCHTLPPWSLTPVGAIISNVHGKRTDVCLNCDSKKKSALQKSVTCSNVTINRGFLCSHKPQMLITPRM